MNVQAALNGSFVTIEIDGNQHPDSEIALTYCFDQVKHLILQCLQEVNCIKFYVVAQTSLQKNVNDENRTTFGFRSRAMVVFHQSNIDEIINECKIKILGSLDSFQQRGSGEIYS